jgi:hypothetical protein
LKYLKEEGAFNNLEPGRDRVGSDKFNPITDYDFQHL